MRLRRLLAHSYQNTTTQATTVATASRPSSQRHDPGPTADVASSATAYNIHSKTTSTDHSRLTYAVIGWLLQRHGTSHMGDNGHLDT